MTGAQIAVAVLTGVMVITGAALLGMSGFVWARVVGTVVITVGGLGYLLLLAMIGSDRRTP